MTISRYIFCKLGKFSIRTGNGISEAAFAKVSRFRHSRIPTDARLEIGEFCINPKPSSLWLLLCFLIR